MARKKQNIMVKMLYQLLKLILRHPLVVSFLAIVIGGWYAYEVQIARPEQVFMGVPKSRYWHQPFTWVRIFRNANFMLGYSDLRGNPLWVSYQIKSVAKGTERYQRPRNYTVDWRSINQVKHADYTHSGYDRGHMAPNYAISRLYGKQAQLNTFLMSNIAPQKPNLNQKLWQRLEEVEIKHFTQLNEQVWVLTGPVFMGDTERLPNAMNVEIPAAFYKIYVLPCETDALRIIAFLMPQQVTGNEPLTDYVTSVDAIEELTGLDFFTDLDDDIEESLEAMIDIEPWQLQQVANLQSRY